jgi:hypothetical protein
MITTLEESDDVEVVVVNYLTEEYNFLKYVPLTLYIIVMNSSMIT